MDRVAGGGLTSPEKQVKTTGTQAYVFNDRYKEGPTLHMHAYHSILI